MKWGLKEHQSFWGWGNCCCLWWLMRSAIQKQCVTITLQEWLNPCEQGLLLALGLWTSILLMPTQHLWDSNQILWRTNQCCKSYFQCGIFYSHPDYSSKVSWSACFWTEKQWKNMDHIVVKRISFMTHSESNSCDQCFWKLNKLLRYSGCTLSSL